MSPIIEMTDEEGNPSPSPMKKLREDTDQQLRIQPKSSGFRTMQNSIPKSVKNQQF